MSAYGGSTWAGNGDPAGSPAASGEDALRALTTEVAALRRQVEALTARVAGASSTLPPDEPTDDP